MARLIVWRFGLADDVANRLFDTVQRAGLISEICQRGAVKNHFNIKNDAIMAFSSQFGAKNGDLWVASFYNI